MAKPLTFSDHEKVLLLHALELAQKSALRAQHGKMPELASIYKRQETDLVAIRLKIQDDR